VTDPAEPTATDPASATWRSERRALYAILLHEGLEPDNLHQLLVEKGAALLDAAVPYLVVAARNRARSAARRDRRRLELHDRDAEDVSQRRVPLDPADVVVARAELSAAIEALSQLQPKYSWPLWWHAAGFGDEEICELWNEAGFLPPDPSLAAIRKRRERARTQLRRRLASAKGEA